MTDNRTTERLRALLDERGVEYETHDIIIGKAVTWTGGVCNWVALPDERGLAVGVYKDYLTPEQAIAATLGESDEGCYLMRDGKKFPVELDYGFLGIMPISITVGGFRYLLEVPNGK